MIDATLLTLLMDNTNEVVLATLSPSIHLHYRANNIYILKTFDQHHAYTAAVKVNR